MKPTHSIIAGASSERPCSVWLKVLIVKDKTEVVTDDSISNLVPVMLLELMQGTACIASVRITSHLETHIERVRCMTIFVSSLIIVSNTYHAPEMNGLATHANLTLSR